jgi:hypothetical protein
MFAAPRNLAVAARHVRSVRDCGGCTRPPPSFDARSTAPWFTRLDPPYLPASTLPAPYYPIMQLSTSIHVS